MYNITVNKITYKEENNKTKKQFIKLYNITVDSKSLVTKMLELKKIYKDFNYNITFDKI